MIPGPLVGFLDANVLYPFTLRDTLLRCAEHELFQIVWSDRVLDETARNLVRKTGMDQTKADRLIAQLKLVFPDSLVEDYDDLIPAMRNHPKDRHVAAAAAVRAGARVIVTFNLNDFRSLTDGPEVQAPDAFLCHLFDFDPKLMVAIIRQQAADLRNPPRSAIEIAKALAKVAPQFGATLLTRL